MINQKFILLFIEKEVGKFLNSINDRPNINLNNQKSVIIDYVLNELNGNECFELYRANKLEELLNVLKLNDINRSCSFNEDIVFIINNTKLFISATYNQYHLILNVLNENNFNYFVALHNFLLSKVDIEMKSLVEIYENEKSCIDWYRYYQSIMFDFLFDFHLKFKNFVEQNDFECNKSDLSKLYFFLNSEVKQLELFLKKEFDVSYNHNESNDLLDFLTLVAKKLYFSFNIQNIKE